MALLLCHMQHSRLVTQLAWTLCSTVHSEYDQDSTCVSDRYLINVTNSRIVVLVCVPVKVVSVVTSESTPKIDVTTVIRACSSVPRLNLDRKVNYHKQISL